jgi:molybdenum cofactor cytidylyltransferase
MIDRPDSPRPEGIRVSTVMLAAGRSSRMGGAHKLLEILEGRSALEWALDAPVAADLGPVVVVTGHRGDDVGALLPPGVSRVHNPDWAEGMASSLRIGVAALPGTPDAVAIALGDMPAVEASHYIALASAWTPGRIVVPTHGGQRGHPVLWPATLVGEFTELRGDTGARPLLARHAALVDEIFVDDPGVVLDIDEPDDLDRAAGLLRSRRDHNRN